MSLAAGSRLGPYELLGRIGAGGMGEVWKARDARLDRIVAIKVSKTEFSERFEREARAVAALNHPSICTLHDVGPNYLVMEYLEGTELKGPAATRSGPEVRGADLRCSRCRAQEQHHTSRPQTSEHPGNQGRRQTPGFRTSEDEATGQGGRSHHDNGPDRQE
jgi:Protein kinase domain